DGVAADHLAAERLNQRLMAEADPEDRNARLGEGADRLDRDPCLLGSPRPGRDPQPVRLEIEQLRDRGLVVADHADLRAELTEVLDEVVGERVVVVDDEHAGHGHSGCSPASSTARKTALALLIDSLYS